MANLRPKVLNANGYDELLDDGDNIKLVAAPATDDAAANKAYVDQQIDAINNPGGDPIYVRKAGDNMTGDLTLGTDKITLGVDGSATFAGLIKAGFTEGTDIDEVDVIGTQLGYGGIINSRYGPTKPVFRAREAQSTTWTSEILADGSATFANENVRIGSLGDLKVKSRGQSYFAHFNSNTNATSFVLYNTTSEDFTTSASASFIQRNDGNVYIGNDLQVVSGSGNPTNTKIALKAADGSATFAGGLAEINNVGQVYAAGFLADNVISDNSIVFRGKNASGTVTSLIRADGSATFTGPLEAASIDGGSY